MKVKYFADTDTLLINFSDNRIAETRDINESILVELDERGRLVSMTVEHARQQMNVSEFSYQLATP
ncbi:MAG: DUF2283 domain-containing protein [Planctomycetes bacterium]|nr:DUF2283 domain-containing protein [Planctomycetota bacterium]MBM4079836.1 DUF2283 domain-containing protein [Planctomycetota bacterium]MBM4083385.1 DUF2283 domain-containing protein [Planctomycetota bacterium]